MLNETEVGGVALGGLEDARSATGSTPSAAAENMITNTAIIADVTGQIDLRGDA